MKTILARSAACGGAALIACCGWTAAAATPPGDLDGVWTNASYTRLQRPRTLPSLVATPEQARAYEAPLRAHHGVSAPPDDKTGQIDSEFSDSGDGLARIRGEIRTSWITDPADGRVPYTEEAKRRLGFGRPAPDDDPEDLSASDRCTFSNGSAPPQMSSMDTNLFQIVQTPSQVAIVSEKNHGVRLIEIAAARRPHTPPTWTGDSIGRWDGASLVVETRGFREPLVDRFFFTYSNAAVIEERFTRTGPDEILYAFTVHDPTMYTRDWRGEEVFKASRQRMFEFACHEGNYSLPNILAGARRRDRESASTTTPK